VSAPTPPATEDAAAPHDDELITGVPVQLSPLVRRVLAPNPGPMTGQGTNTYLIGTDDVTVVDPGPADPGHIEAILEAGSGRIRRIVCTHTHIDHWPAADEVARRTCAEVLAFTGRDGLSVTGTLADGDSVRTDEYELRALHTPGHASNHLCFLLVDEGLLFSGDHVMQGSTVVISPPDGDMSDYLTSLARLRSLEPPLCTIAPAHGHLLHDPAAVLDAYVAHRLGREAIVAEALAATTGRPVAGDGDGDGDGEGDGEGDGVTVDELVPVVYADVHEALYPVARRSLWAHLRKLADDGRATVDDPDDIDTARWRPA
jgi:glyoxylase-like metal-dependent hydrolase (beta-lactamase superfamily II)